MSQSVCPWNVSFTTVLREPAFALRATFHDAGSRDGTRALARELLMMDAADYAAAFKGSAIKRAKLMLRQRATHPQSCTSLRNASRLRRDASAGAMLADTAFTNASSRLYKSLPKYSCPSRS